MKRFKLVLVAFAVISFVSFYSCTTTTSEGDLEDALNELTNELEKGLDELEAEVETVTEEVVAETDSTAEEIVAEEGTTEEAATETTEEATE